MKPFRVGDIVYVGGPEELGVCELCKKTADLRPYGPGGKDVCFECAMKDEKEARRRFGAILDGESVKVH